MAKVSTNLKDLKDNISIVRATELERRIGRTIMDSYRDIAHEEFITTIVDNGGIGLAMPTLQYYCDKAKGLKEKLIGLYNLTMCNVPGFDRVSDNVKLSQGALLDGLCYVYDVRTGDVTLATMNLDILYDLSVETNMEKQIIKKNLEGVCKAYKINIEYINGDQEFKFKAVNARNYDIDDPKPDSDMSKNFVLSPYTAGVQLMKVCESLLASGKVLRVDQTKSGIVKTRFLTNNKNALSAFCDSQDAIHYVEPSFFPLKSYFYAPCLGASSLTAMVSRVDLFDADSISVASPATVKEAGIRKPQNPVRDVIGERLFIAKVLQMKDTNKDLYNHVVENLADLAGICINGEDYDGLDKAFFSSYLHSLTPDVVEDAYRTVDVEGKVNSVMRYFSGKVRRMTEEELANLDGTLSEEVCKFTIRKRDCSLGSVLGTNNKSVLAAVYGTDISQYESFSSRFYSVISDLKDFRNAILSGKTYSVGSVVWKDLVQSYTDSSLVLSKESYLGLVMAVNDCDETVFMNKAKAYAAKDAGINLVRSEAASKAAAEMRERGIVSCKSLTATIDENGKCQDFIREIDRTKVLSAWVLELNN